MKIKEKILENSNNYLDDCTAKENDEYFLNEEEIKFLYTIVWPFKSREKCFIVKKNSRR